ncbi:DUF1015 domain-containing protein [Spirillospora sp. NPDC029432]|uniref:DUF1015 domain-containing protein n=1 Tax=Spirillospora sp. NPDC029432 TaxID=3154599 RepID=UPI003454DFED
MRTVEADFPPELDPEEFSARIFGAGPRPAAGPGRGAGLELAPFRGVRFAPHIDPASVTSPPYDLLDRDQVESLKAGGGHNIVRLTLPDGYGDAAATFRRWLADGSLITDPAPALYLYETEGQRGLIGALGIRAEADQVVLPHENVYPGPVRDRLALMEATRANLEPIFLIYEGGGDTAEIIDSAAERPPLMDFRAGGQPHRLWRIDDPALHARIAADLAPRQALIADGHHRYATYRALQARHPERTWDHGLALLVDSTRYPPHLGAIHRVLPGLPPSTALARAREAFDVTPVSGTDALRDVPGPAFLLPAADGGLHLLTNPDPGRLERAMPRGHSARWRALDTAILDHLLIRDLWKIPEDERSVEVVHDDPAAAIARARRTGGTAVILNPLKVEDVLAVAAEGERVPRKSTSFGPKPRTGLVLRRC